MKIHFCDLCNESVPQSDLDRGAAFLIKGRVVCSRCNYLMHGDVAAGLGSAGPFGASASAEGEPSAEPGALGATQELPPGAQAHVRVHSRPGTGAGVALAVVAVLALAGAGIWLFDRGERAEREGSLRHQALQDRVGGLSQDLGQSLDALRTELSEIRSSMEADRALSETRLAAALSGLEKQGGALEAGFGGLERRVGTMEESLSTLQLREATYAELRKRLDGVERELRDLGHTVADVIDEQRSRPAQAADPSASGTADEPGAPAWMGLVAQLASPDDGKRWQAVTALGESRDPAVVEYLIPVLKDKDVFVRMATARMLGALGAPQAVSALIDALEDPEGSVREMAYLAIKDITGRDLPQEALSEDPAERAKRVKALREWWEKEKQRFGL